MEESWDLVQRHRQDEQDLIAVLFECFHGLVASTSRRLSGGKVAEEDLAQEVFLRLLHLARSGRFPRAPIRAWLLLVTRNAVFSRLRTLGSRPKMVSASTADDEVETLVERAAARDSGPLQDLGHAEFLDWLSTAPPRLQAVYDLRRDGEPIETIVKATGSSQSTVHRDLTVLRGRLTEFL